ncbi:MAG: hypothetical protein JRE58_02375 [Deltaproteobacteria bacterium]|nr:hypothetical protein [Deltaproteobacteria bacterium]
MIIPIHMRVQDLEGWLQYEFPTAVVIGQYTVTTRNQVGLPTVPKSWTFEGSDCDGSDDIPTMTSNTTPSGVVSASAYFPGCDPWRAFKDDNSDSYAATSGWLQYQFASGKVITRYIITTRNQAGVPTVPKSWTLKGSNNGTDWDVLDTQSNVTDWAAWYNYRRVFDISNSTSYTHYRIDITASNSLIYVGIGELEMMEGAYAILDTQADVTDWAYLADEKKYFLISNTTAYKYYRIDITESNDNAFMYVGIGEMEMMEAVKGLPLMFLVFPNAF